MTEFLQVRLDANQGPLPIWLGEPFLGSPMQITAQFGEPRNNGVGYHTGIDLAPLNGMPGAPIAFASQGFFIQWVGVYQGFRSRDVNGGYGNVLLGRMNSGYTALIAHQQRFCDDILRWLGAGYDPNLKPTFSPGEILGYQGNTGYVFGPNGIPQDDDFISGTHTHLEIRDPQGNLVDPRTVITG